MTGSLWALSNLPFPCMYAHFAIRSMNQKGNSNLTTLTAVNLWLLAKGEHFDKLKAIISMFYNLLNKILIAVHALFAGEVVDNLLNPVHLVIATSHKHYIYLIKSAFFPLVHLDLKYMRLPCL